MEKVSIVRRRLEVTPTQAELRARQRLEERSSSALAVLAPPGDEAAVAIGFTPPLEGEFAPGMAPSETVSLDLSPETREELWSGDRLDETPSGARHFIVEAVRDRESERMVLKLSFMKPEYYLRLLTTDEVCEMLHVSRSSLYHYARTGDLRTHRLGGHLRFRFQDVLDFITACQVRKA